jgi:hypothetical protein
VGSLGRTTDDRPAWAKRQAAKYRSFFLLCCTHYNISLGWAQALSLLYLIIVKAGAGKGGLL